MTTHRPGSTRRWHMQNMEPTFSWAVGRVLRGTRSRAWPIKSVSIITVVIIVAVI